MKSAGQVYSWGLHALRAALFLPLMASAADNSYCESVEQKALQNVVLASVNNLSASLSALRSIRESDSKLAITTLEAGLRSNLTIVYALLPELSGDKKIIEDTLREAEKYAKDHGLKIIKPAGVK